MKIDVSGCQRCGRDHAGLEFRELTNPADDWRWWATCPETGEPVLARVLARFEIPRPGEGERT